MKVFLFIFLLFVSIVGASDCDECTDSHAVEPVTRSQAEIWVNYINSKFKNGVVLVPNKGTCSDGYFPCSGSHMCESFVRVGFKDYIQREIKIDNYEMIVFKVKVKGPVDYIWCNKEDNLGYISPKFHIPVLYGKTFRSKDKEPSTREELQHWIKGLPTPLGSEPAWIIPPSNECSDGYFPCITPLEPGSTQPEPRMCSGYVHYLIKLIDYDPKYQKEVRYVKSIRRDKKEIVVFERLPYKELVYVLCTSDERMGLMTEQMKVIDRYFDDFVPKLTKKSHGASHRQYKMVKRSSNPLRASPNRTNA